MWAMKAEQSEKQQTKEEQKQLEAELLAKQKEQEKNAEENRIEHRYLDTLMFKHNRSQFILNETHSIFGPGYYENSHDI